MCQFFPDRYEELAKTADALAAYKMSRLIRVLVRD
jgi:hypothetical protein